MKIITIEETIRYVFELEELPEALAGIALDDATKRAQKLDEWFCALDNPSQDATSFCVDERTITLEGEGYAPGECRQTSCKHCGLDVENFAPFKKGEWRDRGGNTRCNGTERAHEGVL